MADLALMRFETTCTYDGNDSAIHARSLVIPQHVEECPAMQGTVEAGTEFRLSFENV